MLYEEGKAGARVQSTKKTVIEPLNLDLYMLISVIWSCDQNNRAKYLKLTHHCYKRASDPKLCRATSRNYLNRFLVIRSDFRQFYRNVHFCSFRSFHEQTEILRTLVRYYSHDTSLVI